MAFDIEGARRAGYSEEEIQSFLKSRGMEMPQPPAPGKVPEIPAPTVENPNFLQDVGQSAPGEFARGVVGLLTLPRTATDVIDQTLGLSEGTPPQLRAQTKYPSYDEAMQGIQSFIPGGGVRPQTTGGKYVGTALQMLPGAGIGPGGWFPKLLQWGGSSIGSEAAAQHLGDNAATRTLGSIAGASPMGMARKLVTPNPYNPKGLAALGEMERDAAAATRAYLDPRGAAASRYFAPGKQPAPDPDLDAAIKALNRSASVAGTGSKPFDYNQLYATTRAQAPSGNPSVIPGEQYRLMTQALRDEIARTTSTSPQRAKLQNLQNSLENLMDVSTRGTKGEGAWAAPRAQAAELAADVEQRATKGGNILPWLAGLGGTAVGHYGGLKYGPGVSHALGYLMGHGAGSIAQKVLPSPNNIIPGYNQWLRNQYWQPSDWTRVGKLQQAGMLGSGDLVLPPLLDQPPQ